MNLAIPNEEHLPRRIKFPITKSTLDDTGKGGILNLWCPGAVQADVNLRNGQTCGPESRMGIPESENEQQSFSPPVCQSFGAGISPPKKNQTRAAALSGINFPISDKGFTLIELLVVIAILSLLISILLPSLKNAKDLAREVVCTSNLRQIGVAWDMFLMDNDDTFPIWDRNMHWFYGGKHPAIANEEEQRVGLPTLHYRPLNPYFTMKLQNESGVGLFRCPADRAISHPGGEVTVSEGYDTYDFYGNSYMMNWMLLFAWDSKTLERIPGQLRVGDVEISASQLVVSADCQWYYSVNDGLWDANFHNYDDRVGMVFLDGHAGFIQIIRGESVTEDYSFWMYEIFEEEEQE